MKWSIHQLQKTRDGTIRIDEAVDLTSVLKRNPEIRAIEPVHVTGSCTIDSKKLTCHFQLEGQMTLPCARTWEDVQYPFQVATDEQFSWDEATLASDETIHPVIGHTIDPTDLFEQLVLLEVPMQVFSEQAKEMSTSQGEGWSYTTDEEYSEQLRKEKESKVDPRFAALANLFDVDKD